MTAQLVLDDVRDYAGRDLLGDDQALAIGPDLGEQTGEHLDRVRAHAVVTSKAPTSPGVPVNEVTSATR